MSYRARRTAPPPPPLLLPLLIAMLLCGAGVCLSAAEEQKGGKWEPLRIHVSTEDLKNPEMYCSAAGVERSNFRGGTLTCEKNHVVNEDRKKVIFNTILPTVVKLHTDRLLVQRASSPLKVPEFEEENPCSYFTVPEEHHDWGVNDTDMVLYTIVLPVAPFGCHCALGEDKRPIVGSLLLDDKYGMPLQTVRRAAHEIAHALGFDLSLMSSLGTLLKITLKSQKMAIRMKSPRVLEKAREHFNCSTLQGIRIWGGSSYFRSHWGYDVVRDELMSMTYKSAGLYTALTMAAFEDMGFFRAQWGKEEPMQWGRNAGCDFPPTNCEAETIKRYPRILCNHSNTKRQCSSNRLFLGVCKKINGTEPEDHCGYLLERWMCSAKYSENPAFLPGSLRGRGSWCLDAEELIAQKKVSGTEVVAGVCAKVKCAGGRVQVQYKGNSEWHECPEGGVITPTSPSFKSGRIKCPKYDEVCTIADDGSSLVSQHSQ